MPAPAYGTPQCWQGPPSTAGLGAAGDEPTTAALVAQTLGWLALGGVVGAAMWTLAHEVMGVHRGQR